MSSAIHELQLPKDPDYYFRPWKVYPEIETSIKTARDNDINSIYHKKIQEHEQLLMRLSKELDLKPSIHNNLKLILWSSTHIKCLLIVEKDWLAPLVEDVETSMKRHQLIDKLPIELYEPINELACWVWEQRFTLSGYQIDFGGWLFLTMIQVNSSLMIHTFIFLTF